MVEEPISRKGKGNVLKVVELGLQDKVYDALKNNISVEKLTKTLNDDGVKITSQSIRKFIKKTKKAQSELIKTDLKEVQEYKKMQLDYNRTLKAGLMKLEEKLSQAEQIDDLASWNALYKSMLQTVDLFAKLAGDINPAGSTKVDINVIYNEIVEKMEKGKTKSDLFSEKTIDVDAYVLDEEELEKRRLEEEEL